MALYQVGIEFIVNVEADTAKQAIIKINNLYRNRDVDFSNYIPVIGDYVEEVEE